jgi:IS30 family transposase
LAIAALFNPLRRRVQGFIDRRFYRQKYDAEKALAEFAAAARSETDLAQLSKHLTGTVQQALQPEQITLWLRANTYVETKQLNSLDYTGESRRTTEVVTTSS